MVDFLEREIMSVRPFLKQRNYNVKIVKNQFDINITLRINKKYFMYDPIYGINISYNKKNNNIYHYKSH